MGIKEQIKNHFKEIQEEMVQKEDGSYSFKYDHDIMAVTLDPGDAEINFDPIEVACEAFEKFIVPQAAQAILVIIDKFEYQIDLTKSNVILKEYSELCRQIDYYEAIKTLFFPAMKERMVKIGKSKPESIYKTQKARAEMEEVGGKFETQIITEEDVVQMPTEGAAMKLLKEDIAKLKDPLTKENSNLLKDLSKLINTYKKQLPTLFDIVGKELESLLK